MPRAKNNRRRGKRETHQECIVRSLTLYWRRIQEVEKKIHSGIADEDDRELLEESKRKSERLTRLYPIYAEEARVSFDAFYAS